MPRVKKRICSTEGCTKEARFNRTKCGTCTNKNFRIKRSAERAEARKNKAKNYKPFPREEILENVKMAILSMIHAGEKWNSESITQSRYREHGGTYDSSFFTYTPRYDSNPYYKRDHFNGWKEVVALALKRAQEQNFQTEMTFEYKDDDNEDYYYTESSIKVQYTPGIVECLRCGNMFESWDVKHNRICCKFNSNGEYLAEYADDAESDRLTSELWISSGPGGKLEHYGMGW